MQRGDRGNLGWGECSAQELFNEIRCHGPKRPRYESPVRERGDYLDDYGRASPIESDGSLEHEIEPDVAPTPRPLQLPSLDAEVDRMGSKAMREMLKCLARTSHEAAALIEDYELGLDFVELGRKATHVLVEKYKTAEHQHEYGHKAFLDVQSYYHENYRLRWLLDFICDEESSIENSSCHG